MGAGYRLWQFRTALRARITPAETALADCVLPPMLRHLFHAMPPSDQRHALNVFHHLRVAGYEDEALLQAALLHDVGKATARVGLATRVAVVLLCVVDRRLVARLARPYGMGWQRALYAHAHHAAIGADLVSAAGGLPPLVLLIREHGGDPVDDVARALRTADEAN